MPRKPRAIQERLARIMRQKRSGRPRKRRWQGPARATGAAAGRWRRGRRAGARTVRRGRVETQWCSWRQVVDGRVRPQLRLQRRATADLDELEDLALRVVEVAEDARLGGAVGDAGRLEPGVDAVDAEVALHHRADLVVAVAGVLVGRRALVGEVVALLVVEVAGAVGAGLHAGAAADAGLAVDVGEAGFAGGAGGR